MLESIIFFAIPLFLITYMAVRLAIRPLMKKQDNPDYLQKINLLRKNNLIEYQEKLEITELFDSIYTNKKHEQEKQLLIEYLAELKELGYFTDEEYLKRIDKI